MSRVEVRVADPSQIALQWERLASEVAAAPFIRPGWVFAWHRAFGRGELVILAAYEDGVLVGVLPLQRHRGVVSSPANWHTPEFDVVAQHDIVTDALLRAALRAGRRRLEMGFVGSALAQRLEAVAALDRRPALARVLQSSPYLELGASFTDYLSRQSRNLRKTIRRRFNNAERMGSLSFTVKEDPTVEDLEEFYRVEASGWKGRSGTAIASTAETLAFYTEVSRWAADRGWLRVSSTRLDHRPLACDLSLECEGVLYMLKHGIDEDFADVSPGTIHQHAVIEWVFSKRLDGYDFTGGADPWKMHWTKTTRDRWLVQVFGRGPLGRLDQLAFQHVRPRVAAALRRRRSK